MTPDEKVAELAGGAIDGRIFRLELRRAELLNAAQELAEVDAELASLRTEKARVDPRRPRPDPIIPPVIDRGPDRRNVNSVAKTPE